MVALGTQEMTGQEMSSIMDLNQSFVNVLLLPDDPNTMAKLLKFLKNEQTI